MFVWKRKSLSQDLSIWGRLVDSATGRHDLKLSTSFPILICTTHGKYSSDAPIILINFIFLSVDQDDNWPARKSTSSPPTGLSWPPSTKIFKKAPQSQTAFSVFALINRLEIFEWNPAAAQSDKHLGGCEKISWILFGYFCRTARSSFASQSDGCCWII